MAFILAPAAFRAAFSGRDSSSLDSSRLPSAPPHDDCLFQAAASWKPMRTDAGAKSVHVPVAGSCIRPYSSSATWCHTQHSSCLHSAESYAGGAL